MKDIRNYRITMYNADGRELLPRWYSEEQPRPCGAGFVFTESFTGERIIVSGFVVITQLKKDSGQQP